MNAQQDIIENNALIAEFMGFKTGKQLGYDRWENNYFDENKRRTERLHFDSEWNSLMPVADKIQSLSGTVRFWNNTCQIKIWNMTFTEIENNQLEACYSAIVKFIKKYNESK